MTRKQIRLLKALNFASYFEEIHKAQKPTTNRIMNIANKFSVAYANYAGCIRELEEYPHLPLQHRLVEAINQSYKDMCKSLLLLFNTDLAGTPFENIQKKYKAKLIPMLERRESLKTLPDLIAFLNKYDNTLDKLDKDIEMMENLNLYQSVKTKLKINKYSDKLNKRNEKGKALDTWASKYLSNKINKYTTRLKSLT